MREWFWKRKKRADEEMEALFERNEVYLYYEQLSLCLKELKSGERILEKRSGFLVCVEPYNIWCSHSEDKVHLHIEVSEMRTKHAYYSFDKKLFSIDVKKIGYEVNESRIKVNNQYEEIDMLNFVIIREIIKDAKDYLKHRLKYEKLYYIKKQERIIEALKKEEERNRLRKELNS